MFVLAGLVGLSWVCSAEPALAQTGGRLAFEALTGHSGYVDEVWDNRLLVGGEVRKWVTPRFAIGPELTYQVGVEDASELIVTATMTYDLPRKPSRRVAFFLVGAAGVSRRTARVGRGPGTTTLADYVSHELTASAGIGGRVRVGRGVFAAADARVGWEPERRVTLSLGWRPS